MPRAIKLMLVLFILGSSSRGLCQLTVTTTEKFNNLFTTAGYSTAFGAALGAAVLGLSKKPSTNLRYIGIGASIGFISGSLLGVLTSFIMPSSFQQTQGESSLGQHGGLLAPSFKHQVPRPDKPFHLYLQPIFNDADLQLNGMSAGIVLTTN